MRNNAGRELLTSELCIVCALLSMMMSALLLLLLLLLLVLAQYPICVNSLISALHAGGRDVAS